MLPSIAKLSCVSKLISFLQNALLSLIVLADNSAKEFRAACPSVTYFIFTANLVKWIRQRISWLSFHIHLVYVRQQFNSDYIILFIQFKLQHHWHWNFNVWNFNGAILIPRRFNWTATSNRVFNSNFWGNFMHQIETGVCLVIISESSEGSSNTWWTF